MPTGSASLPKLNHTPVIERETLIYKVTPVYPAIAKSAHVNGEVVVKIMIGKDGSVRNLVIEKGPAMLRGAVLEAVRQWKYKPYKVDGDPREIESIVSVNFR
jgi:protein TonB